MMADEKVREAIEYDLIALGLRLRNLCVDDDFNWRDLKVVVVHSPETSAQFRQAHPNESLWGIKEHLLSRAVEALERLWWAKTKDAKYNRNRPEPVYRPGVERDTSTDTIGAEAIPTDQMDEWLGWSPIEAVNT